MIAMFFFDKVSPIPASIECLSIRLLMGIGAPKWILSIVNGITDSQETEAARDGE